MCFHWQRIAFLEVHAAPEARCCHCLRVHSRRTDRDFLADLSGASRLVLAVSRVSDVRGVAHQSDSLVVPELRVATCGSEALTTVLMTDSLAVPRNQLLTLLVIAARSPESANARSAEARLSGAVDSRYPGRYCSASAWMRVAYVADTSTYHVRVPMRRAAVWPVNRSGGK